MANQYTNSCRRASAEKKGRWDLGRAGRNREHAQEHRVLQEEVVKDMRRSKDGRRKHGNTEALLVGSIALCESHNSEKLIKMCLDSKYQ